MERSLATASPRPDAASAGADAQGGLAALADRGVRSAASDAAIFTLGTYAAQVLLFVAGVIQKGLLGPVATGYWALMGTFSLILGVAPFGALEGGMRQLPLHRGRGDHAAAAAVADTASSFTMLSTTIAGALLVGAALAFGSGWPPELQFGLILLGVTAPVKFLSDCHESIIQSTKRFTVASAAAIVRAAVALTLQTLFVWWLGFYGMFLGMVAAVLATFVLWNRLGLTSFRAPAFHWRIEGRRLRELTRFGLPTMIHGQVWALFLAVDNLIVAAFLDVEQLGYYALAVSVTSYIMLLPTGIGAALAPRMAEHFGRTHDAGSIRHYATDVQRLLAYLFLPVLVAAAFFLMPVLIRHALPEFAPAIRVVHIMVAGTFFVALSTMPIKLQLAAGYRWSVAGWTLVALAINVAANFVAVGVLDRGLTGAAVAVGFSYFTLFAIMTGFALSRTLRPHQVVSHAAEIVGVFAYLTAVMWAVEEAIGSGAGLLVPDAAVGLAKLCLVLISLAPWLILAQARFGGVSTVRSLVSSAWTKGRRRG
jgi:O-antigen/teichoic acid export membrane protein